MMTQQSKLLDIARGYIGVKESPANSNNVIFNTHYYGQAVHDGMWGTKFPWCAVFVWDVFRLAGLAALYYGGGKTASCPTLYRYHKQRGQTVPFEQAQPGDMVLFTFSAKRNADHVGIVESRQGGTLVTIEGNTAVGNEGNGGMVMRRTRKKNVVLAVVRPAWESVKKEEDVDMEEVKRLLDEQKREILAEVKELVARKVYDSVEECPSWSREAVAWAVERGYIQGSGGGKLGLDDSKVWALQVNYNMMSKGR